MIQQRGNQIRILDDLRHYLLTLHRQSRKHPKTLLFCGGFIFLVALGLSSRLQFLLSIDDLIDPDFKTYQDLKKVNESFHDRSTVLLSIESEAIFSKPYLCDLQTWILENAEKRLDLIEINSSFGVPKIESSTKEFRMPSGLKINCDDLKNPETEAIEAGLKRIRLSPWKDVLSLSKNYGLTVNFLVQDPEDKKYGSIDTHIVGELESSYMSALGKKYPKIKTYWGGITTYQSHLRHAFDQTLALNALMYLIAWILFRLFFGSWRLGSLFNLTVIGTSLITYGFMGALRIPIDALSNSVGLMLMLACLEDFVFIAYGRQKMGWSLKKSLRVFLLPSFFTSLTTAIGFGSLVTSDLGVIRRFGIACSAAAMIEWAMVFLLLPACLNQFPKWRIFRPIQGKKTLNLTGWLKFRPSKGWTMGLCLLVFVPLLFINHLRVSDSPADFFSKNHIANRTLEHLLQTRGWANEVSLLMDPSLSREQEVVFLDQIEKLPHVHQVESEQKVKKFLGQDLDHNDQILVESLWDSSNASHRLQAFNGARRAQVFLDTMDMDHVRTLIEEVHNICPNNECRLVGSLISYNEYSLRVLKTLFSSLGLSLILVAIILLLAAKHLSRKEIFYSLLSAVWGPLALLSIFIVFDIPLFFVSCVCASVLVGLTGDNALQFILRSRRSSLSQSVTALAPASFILTLMMMLITSIFFMSDMAPLSKLSGFMILGFFLGFVGDVFILKGWLKQ